MTAVKAKVADVAVHNPEAVAGPLLTTEAVPNTELNPEPVPITARNTEVPPEPVRTPEPAPARVHKAVRVHNPVHVR